MRKIKRLLAVALSAATLFSLTACEKEENTATGEWTVETVYAKAQELGFEGTWEEFREEMRGAQGVGIADVGVSADGDLVVTLTSGKQINCGKVRLGACDHSYGSWQTGAEATCESIGYKMRTCSKCEDVEYAFEAAKGHEWLSAGDAYENVYVCETCGLLKYSESTTTPDDSAESSKSFLKISVYEDAYGTDWLEAAAEQFEYYYANTAFEAGKKGVSVFIERTTIPPSSMMQTILNGNNQIFLTTATDGLLFNAVQSGVLKDITEVVTSPLTSFEETVSLGEKLVKEAFEVNEKAYAIPYLADNWGILYNRDIFTEYGYEVPNTTDEWFALFAEMKENGVVPMTFAGAYGAGATEWLTDVWWAQYEGLSGYMNFWNGIDDGNYSKDIFKQQGRLEALTTYAELLSNQDNFHTSAFNNVTTFTEAQMRFLIGDYRNEPIAMLFDGEWMLKEAENTLQQIEASYGKTPDIGMMRTPVLSSIVNTLEDTTMTDETLSAVISAIDGGATSYTGVSEADFQKIKAARGVTSSLYHQFFVNNNVTAEQMSLAKEFLQFLSCDLVLSEVAAYGVRTNLTSTLPTTVYDNLDSVKKDAYEIAKTATPLPDETGFLLHNAGLQAWQTSPYQAFRVQSASNQKTAQQLFAETIAYWTESNFQQMLARAGLV